MWKIYDKRDNLVFCDSNFELTTLWKRVARRFELKPKEIEIDTRSTIHVIFRHKNELICSARWEN